MIIVTGSIEAQPDTLDRILELSLDHVRRSRLEPGCVSHAAHRDAEDELRIVFFEQWESTEALMNHFAVPESGEFVAEASRLAASPPHLAMYEAEPLVL